MAIVVLGSLNMDIVIPVNRYPRSGETVVGGQVTYNPGGKGANQALACARLGAPVTMLGMVGTDTYAKELKSTLERGGVNTGYVLTHEGPSGMAFVHVEPDAANRIIVSPGANDALTPERLKSLEEMITHASAVLVQLEVPIETVAWMTDVATAARVPVFLDPAPVQSDLFTCISMVDWITPNQVEAELLTGQCVKDVETAHLAAFKLQSLGARNVVLKMGEHGAYVFEEDGRPHYHPGFAVNAVDTTAAGDAFNAAFAVDYVEHHRVERALGTACAVGALTVTKRGAQASLPSRQEVLSFLASQTERFE